MFEYNDGGRESAGFKGTSDCAVRAIAIACNMSYKDARYLLREFSNKGKLNSRAISLGIYKEDMCAALLSLGWEWVSAPKIPGRKARYTDINGTAILRMAGHYVAVIDGVLMDTFDSREKMVYGYWRKKRNPR